MKCTIGVTELYPVLYVESAGKNGKHDVPPKLLNALQSAQLQLGETQRAIAKHLLSTGQVDVESAAGINLSRLLESGDLL